MRSLLARLDDPHLGRGTVHVAGSKGKGSTAAMIASVLQEAGVAAGRYTSPHLHRFTERITIGGEPIAEDGFARLLETLLPHADAEDAEGSFGPLSTFEMLTAMAFLCFREREVAWQVLEVGLGGRLDATNVLEEKAVCVITPIGLEHTAILGDTVAQVAAEKAAIITPGATVVMSPQREAAADVIRETSRERGARLIETAGACAMSRSRRTEDGQEFSLRTPGGTYKLRLPLLGRHQAENAAAAVLAVEALAERGVKIEPAAVRAGIAAVRWPARIEILRRRPLIVADGAHDRDSARKLAATLRNELGLSNVLLVIGCARDKDAAALAEELAPLAAQVFATRSRHPRAMDPREVAQAFVPHDVPVASDRSVAAALEAALAQAGPVVACGSLAVAAEAREHVLGVAYDPPPEGVPGGSHLVESK